MVALVFGTGVIAQAQAAEDESQGPVVQIGQADEGTTTPGVEEHDAQGVEHAVPKYWIGLGVGVISPDHVLRAYVDIPEGQGLLVATVAPDSPAAKAGLKQHDILIRANGTDLHELHDLTDLVSAEGANKGKITLDILRKSGHETVAVTPEDRPESAQRPQFGGGEGFGGFGAEGIPQ
jgi:S1-C subfamily serine protease